MSLHEHAVAALAADSSNDGNEEDWRWFFAVLPLALRWIASQWGSAVVFKWNLRILFIRKTISVSVGWVCNKLLWVIDTFGPGTAPVPQEESVS